MKYYNFDTMFTSLKSALFKFLHDNNIYFELSGAAGGWHFEILTDAAGAEKINNFLDANTIWCRGV
jgi:hypothetical protein